jgi:hypothetical protein
MGQGTHDYYITKHVFPLRLLIIVFIDMGTCRKWDMGHMEGREVKANDKNLIPPTLIKEGFWYPFFLYVYLVAHLKNIWVLFSNRV